MVSSSPLFPRLVTAAGALVRGWRGLGRALGSPEPRPDDGPAVVVWIDAVETSVLDRSPGPPQPWLVAVPCAWHRRGELVECIGRSIPDWAWLVVERDDRDQQVADAVRRVVRARPRVRSVEIVGDGRGSRRVLRRDGGRGWDRAWGCERLESAENLSHDGGSSAFRRSASRCGREHGNDPFEPRFCRERAR